MDKKTLEFLLTPEGGESDGAEYRTRILKKEVATELSSDFTLPDYYPEIRKLLRIDTNVSPGGRYIGGSTVEFSGRVDYEMIYVTADGGIASAPLGADFSFEVPLARPENSVESYPIEAVADSEAENATARVLSPRKVNVRCRIMSRVKGYCMVEYAPETEGGGGLERLTEEIMCSDSRRYMSEEQTLSFEIPCDTAELSPIYGKADAAVKDIQASGGILTVSGDVRVNVLCTENGDIQRLSEKQPFKCEIETDVHGDSADTEQWTAFPYVTETSTAVEDGRITVSVTVICCGDLHRSSPLTVICDAYSTEGNEMVETEELEYSSVLAVGGETLKLRGRLRPRNGPLTGESAVCDCGATARIEGCTVEFGRIKLTGVCRVSAAVSSAGDFSSVEDEIPFELTAVPIQIPEGDLSCQCRAAVCGLECVIDGGEIKCDGDIYISYAVTQERRIDVVNSVRLEAAEQESRGIVICYPSAGETLWGISKKYHAPVSSVASVNNLPLSQMASPLPDSVKYVVVCK